MGIKRIQLLGVSVSLLDYTRSLEFIRSTVERHKRVFICVAASHLLVECQKNRELMDGVNRADMVTPDGMPLVWLQKLAGFPEATRVYGPALMGKICSMSPHRGWRIYLLGGAAGQSGELKSILERRYPGITIAGNADTPDKRNVSADAVGKINRSQADIVFVGLGCPHQELWMVHNRKSVKAPVLIGVGAAFDMLSGRKRQAPLWMQHAGLEWLFRLRQEPFRLGKRYVEYNTLFLYYCLRYKPWKREI
jgi:N-acetylglucosaminyldiphosphoundecaprenol N-acetyl-beta-D-mannosaminyltransferase